MRSRLSRIFWRGRFIDYPLRLADVVRKVGPLELTRCAASYLRAVARPRRRPAETFEDWVCARFGRRLYELFFKAYTEKVWGVPPSEIRAEWAAQRIRTLSFWRVVRAALLNDGADVHSLIEQFHYPRLGPGQMWEAMAAEIVGAGGELRLGARVTRIELRDGRVRAVHAGGERIEVGHAISSLPLRDIVAIADPPAPRGGARRGARAALSRLPHGRARRARRRPLPRQLDLRPRSRGARRADPELPRLERGDGARRRPHLRRPGVLLLRGRRAVERVRRSARRAGDARARADRPGACVAASRRGTSCACRRPIRSTTPTTSSA